MRRSAMTSLALVSVLLLPVRVGAAIESARALGGTCYWQSSHGLSESALAFRDRVEAALGFDLFAECDVREQAWGVTVVDCGAATDASTPPRWTLTLRVGFPGGLDRWQACVTQIESDGRLIYSANFFVRYRAQIAAALLLYAVYALARLLLRRRQG